MTDQPEHVTEKTSQKKGTTTCASGGAIYGLGLIGAAIYYISQAATFWAGVLGLLKAFVWPVFMVYEALKFLGD